jgi:hypothetical protein
MAGLDSMMANLTQRRKTCGDQIEADLAEVENRPHCLFLPPYSFPFILPSMRVSSLLFPLILAAKS